METNVQSATEVISAQTRETAPPSPVPTESVRPPAQAARDMDPMDEFGRQLEEIIDTYGSAASLIEKQCIVLETADERVDEEARGEEDDEVTIAQDANAAKDAKKLPKGLGKEGLPLLPSLNKLPSPEDKLDALLQKHGETLEERRGEQKQLRFLQKKQGHLVKEREQLQFEHSRAILARSKLESLCRELQRHNKALKEETLARCREDEEKRREITTHFQSTLTDIQAQIEQHSNRNNKLCSENTNLAEKLKHIISQYEQREESLEKIFKHRDQQQKLTEAKLEQANALLQEAEEKHKREKEYLLRETIDKTKKCYTLKEQELQLKKKLVLYSQKFDEFQTTLSKSNDVYASFKNEMEKMTKKMKKLDKESNVWKTRFESTNKTLSEMIEERTRKENEYEMFVVKIDKLERLCRALQDERKILYSKIKGIRQAPNTPEEEETPKDGSQEGAPEPIHSLMDIVEVPEMTEEMARLRAEQNRLAEFAASIQAKSTGDDDNDDDDDDDSDIEEEPEFTENIEIQVIPKSTLALAQVDVEAPAQQKEPTALTHEEETMQEETPAQASAHVETPVQVEAPAQAPAHVETPVQVEAPAQAPAHVETPVQVEAPTQASAQAEVPRQATAQEETSVQVEALAQPSAQVEAPGQAPAQVETPALVEAPGPSEMASAVQPETPKHPEHATMNQTTTKKNAKKTS